MPITKGKNIRLRRPCRKCNQMFHPSGKGVWTCETCFKKIHEKQYKNRSTNSHKYINFLKANRKVLLKRI